MQVVFFHFGAAYSERHRLPLPVTRLLGNGYEAVSLFFILSGFILAYTYAGQLGRPRGALRFAQARFARIYPVYLLALVWGILLYRPPWQHIVTAGLMVQAWNPFHPTLAEAINAPAWTLSVEAFFYLCFPASLAALLHRRVRALAVVCGLALMIVLFAHTSAETRDISSPTIAEVFRYVPLPVRRLPEFLTGICAGLAFLRHRSERAVALELYSAAALMLILLVTVSGEWVSLLALPNVFLIHALARAASKPKPPVLARFLSSPTLELLGAASYAIYLLQELLRTTLTRLWPPGMSTAALPFVHLALLIGLSVGVYKLYEEPLRRWLRNRFARADAA